MTRNLNKILKGFNRARKSLQKLSENNAARIDINEKFIHDAKAEITNLHHEKSKAEAVINNIDKLLAA